MTAALTLAVKVLGKLFSLPAWVYLVLVVAAWGWHGQHRARAADEARAREQRTAQQEALTASERARETERLLNKTNTGIADELHQAQRARDAAARTAAQRLRDVAQASAAASAAAASCQRYEGAPADVVPGQAREALVDLARDADEVTSQLRACQAYIRDVVKPDGAQTDVR